VLAAFPGFDEPCQFDAVHAGHLNIQHDARKIVVDQAINAASGFRRGPADAGGFQDAFHDVEVAEVVIHQQDINGILGARTGLVPPDIAFSFPVTGRPGCSISCKEDSMI